MQNRFDFYSFQIILGSSYKRACKKLGIDPYEVQSVKDDVQFYGNKSYQRYSYFVTVGHMDAKGSTREMVDAKVEELRDKYKGYNVHTKYICID